MENEKIVVLLVEDNPGDARLIQEMLAESGEADYQLEHADRLSQGLERLLEGRIDVMLLDLSLPDSQGLETLDKVQAQASAEPIIVLTGLDDEMIAVEAVRQGAQDYLVKGDVDSKLLCRAVHYSLERKRAETALRQSEERYRLLAENVTDVIWTADMNFQLTYTSPSIARQRGYSVEEAMTRGIEKDLTPASLDISMKVFSEALAAEKMEPKGLSRTRTLECELYCKNGSTIWTEQEIAFLRDADGQPVGILGVSRDITKRKQSDTALRESEEKMRQLFRSATDGIFTLDLNGTYTELNERMLEMLGVGFKDEILGKNYFEFVKVPDINMVTDEMQRTLGLGTVMHLEYTSLRADFSEFHAELNGALLRDASDNPIGFVGILRDITERKKIEAMKSDFISLVSHQLKTPVMGIKMGIEDMLEGLTGEVTAKQKQYLKVMYELCSKNNRLVNDLLNVSMIDRGSLFANIEPVKLREIVDLAVVDYRNDIEKKGLDLNIEETDKGIVVLAAIDKMVAALSNVINNALKFTEKGSIAIRITDGLTTEGEYGIVEVRDTGTGMSDEVLNNLFTQETALSGPPAVKGGMGIGLYIAKSFMEAQKGEVTATSVAGEGSTFVLRVPRDGRGQSERAHEVKEYEHHTVR